MRISSVASLETTSAGDTLTVRQRACGLSALAQTAILIPALVTVIIPFSMLAADAIAEPATRELLASAPLGTLSAIVGVALWAVLFGVPAWRALRRLGSSRHIEIADGSVVVSDRHLFGKTQWREPLSAFEGLSHHVRTTLSGTRHELVLMHPDRRRSLLVALADNISQNDAEALAERLGVPLTAAGALFRSRRTPAAIAFPASLIPARFQTA